MPLEIERKFLVKKDFKPDISQSVRIIQAYLCTDPERTIRIRIAGEKAFLTIKGAVKGHSRLELEYPVPVDHAEKLMKLAVTNPVEKVRKEIYVDGKKWEIDFFDGANKGLVLAEIELNSEDEEFTIPDWVTEEVSGDMRYYNSRLAQLPFSQW